MSDLIAPLLIEIGCEELPALSVSKMARVLEDNLYSLLKAHELISASSAKFNFYTPRRLAVRVEAVLGESPAQTSLRQGPAVQAAFDSDGQPTPAAIGFARSVNTDVDALQRIDTPKGERLAFEVTQPGRSLTDVLQEHLPDIIKQLPMPKTMRWGNHAHRFLRPVHWLVAMHGEQTLPLKLFDLEASNITYGHRTHTSEPLVLQHADNYQKCLQDGFVMVDPKARRAKIKSQVDSLAETKTLTTLSPLNLLLEVANLVEWPVAVMCSFDDAFLEVPKEALTLSMRSHQKFFPLYHQGNHGLSNQFIAIANLESLDVEQVRIGYERVIRPRLADAKFFWDQDRKQSLGSFSDRLSSVTFQQDLGSLADKAGRTKLLATKIAEKLNIDSYVVARAAELSLCDLMTEMVGEFPELQGIMGRYYALEYGEDAAVATAIEEHYQPIAAGYSIASSAAGKILAIAEKTDRLLGIFAAGKKPTGNKDPFALRRAALGLIRTLIEGEQELALDWLLQAGAEVLSSQIMVSAEIREEVSQFVYDRLEGYLPASVQSFRAVAAKQIDNLLDFAARTQAVEAFSSLPQAASLAAANKRASNLLRKNPLPESTSISEDSLNIDAEELLFAEINNVSGSVSEAMSQRDYASALSSLAALQTPVDQFFEDVMVMVDDDTVRNNRLALLASLQSLCCQVADITELDV